MASAEQQPSYSSVSDSRHFSLASLPVCVQPCAPFHVRPQNELCVKSVNMFASFSEWCTPLLVQIRFMLCQLIRR